MTMSAAVTATHRPYCALQCGLNVATTTTGIDVSGNAAFPINKGALCVKGWSAGQTLRHPERLRAPLVRNGEGVFETATWEDALELITRRLGEIQARHGSDSVGVFGGGALTNEKAYLLGKFARVALGTANIDYNGRFCMSSAAAGQNRAFGIDRGLPFPVADIAGAEVVLLVGSNAADTLPPIMQWLEKQKQAGGRLIVADPRRTATVRTANLFLQLTPGTDLALA